MLHTLVNCDVALTAVRALLKLRLGLSTLDDIGDSFQCITGPASISIDWKFHRACSAAVVEAISGPQRRLPGGVLHPCIAVAPSQPYALRLGDCLYGRLILRGVTIRPRTDFVVRSSFVARP